MLVTFCSFVISVWYWSRALLHQQQRQQQIAPKNVEILRGHLEPFCYLTDQLSDMVAGNINQLVSSCTLLVGIEVFNT